MASKGNTFGTFLTAVNTGGPENKAARGDFEVEAAAKDALRILGARKAMPRQELGQMLALSADQNGQMLSHLEDAGLIARTGDMVELSRFGRDALGVFSVS